jgi:hypothetical protein
LSSVDDPLGTLSPAPAGEGRVRGLEISEKS